MQDAIAIIAPPLNPDDLNLAEINAFMDEIGKFVPEIKKQLTTVETAITEVQQSKDQILKGVLDQLNLAGQLGPVNDFWKNLNNEVGRIEADLGNFVNTIETQVPQMSRYVAMSLYAIGGLFVLMIVMAILVCIRLLFRGFMLRLYLSSEIDGTFRLLQWDGMHPQ